MRRNRFTAFTLAELLIALAILGVIATFTIPKVLQSQQNTEYKAISKEAASMISGAMQAYQAKNTLTASTGTMDLTPYMNFVAVDTSTVIDDAPPAPWGAWPCGQSDGSGGNWICLRLHNGGMLYYASSESFGGTTADRIIMFGLDPDGKDSAVESTLFVLTYKGRLASAGTLSSPHLSSLATYPDVYTDPPWFKWD